MLAPHLLTFVVVLLAVYSSRFADFTTPVFRTAFVQYQGSFFAKFV